MLADDKGDLSLFCSITCILLTSANYIHLRKKTDTKSIRLPGCGWQWNLLNQSAKGRTEQDEKNAQAFLRNQ